MSVINKCPMCGGGDLQQCKSTTKVKIPYANEAGLPLTYWKCGNCKEEFVDDNGIEAALIDAKKASVGPMLSHLTGPCGLAYPHMERALRLPQGTMKKWEKGDISQSEIVLLQIIRTFPWIVHVADDDFELAAVKREFRELIERSL